MRRLLGRVPDRAWLAVAIGVVVLVGVLLIVSAALDPAFGTWVAGPLGGL